MKTLLLPILLFSFSSELAIGAEMHQHTVPTNDPDSMLMLKLENACVSLELHSLPNGELSCQGETTIHYTKRDCGSAKMLEAGEAQARLTCPDKRRNQITFRTSSETITTTLRARRQSRGRSGTVARYAVESTALNPKGAPGDLPAAKVTSSEEAKPEESPLQVKLSGFASLEWEKTSAFGFDGTSARPNFRNDSGKNRQSNFNFFSNLTLDASRDRTSLSGVFEIGEVYFGDDTSGGKQGARKGSIFEVRNLILAHSLDDSIGFKGGLISTNSDPRAFIFSDHLGSVQATYATDLSLGFIWYGEAEKNRPTRTHVQDRYIGAMGTLGFLSGLKTTAYFVHRQKSNDSLLSNDGLRTTLTGKSHYNWIGLTSEGNLGGLSIQGTAIGNRVSTKLIGASDTYNAYLFDLKFAHAIGNSVSVSLEGLATSGNKAVTDTTANLQFRGKRKNFVSPVGTAYLMNIATSDGVDDSVGSPKESIIANLNLDEGLQLLVASVNANISRRASGYLRVGTLRAGHESSATNKRNIGQEIDAGLLYQLSPSTSLQADYGIFFPGDFYAYRKNAKLTAFKMKYSF